MADVLKVASILKRQLYPFSRFHTVHERDGQTNEWADSSFPRNRPTLRCKKELAANDR